MTKKRSWFAALAVAFVLPTAFAATTAGAAEVPNGASSQDGSAVVADIIPAALNGSQPLDDHGDSYSVKAGVTTVNLPKDGVRCITDVRQFLKGLFPCLLDRLILMSSKLMPLPWLNPLAAR